MNQTTRRPVGLLILLFVALLTGFLLVIPNLVSTQGSVYELPDLVESALVILLITTIFAIIGMAYSLNTSDSEVYSEAKSNWRFASKDDLEKVYEKITETNREIYDLLDHIHRENERLVSTASPKSAHLQQEKRELLESSVQNILNEIQNERTRPVDDEDEDTDEFKELSPTFKTELALRKLLSRDESTIFQGLHELLHLSQVGLVSEKDVKKLVDLVSYVYPFSAEDHLMPSKQAPPSESENAANSA